MKIMLSPQRRESSITASVNGDKITINGVEFDFTKLRKGDLLPSSAVSMNHFTGDICRDGDGHIRLTMILPHGNDAPQETRFPYYFDECMVVTVGDIKLPPFGGLND